MGGMLILLFLVGLGAVLLALFVVKDKQVQDNNPINQNKILTAEKKLKEKIDEADKMIAELNKFANHVNDELTEKHKELLFLYEMIDSKYSEQLKPTIKKVEAQEAVRIIKEVPEEAKEEVKEAKVEKKGGYSDIYEMSKKGMSVDEIAKELGIGKGEVKLLLELTQKR